MSVLLTGGLSDFSNQLADGLLQAGRRVVFLHGDNGDQISKKIVGNGALTLVNLSSVNEEGILNLIKKHGIQTVFDASLITSDALLEPIQAAKTLVLGVTSVLDAIRKSASPPSFVLVSGDQVYGSSSVRVETQPLEPTSFVGAAQMSVEAMVHSYAVSYRIPIVIARVAFGTPIDGHVNKLSTSDAVQGVLKVAELADGQKTAEVFNVSNSVEYLVGNPSETRPAQFSNEKIRNATNWTPSAEFVQVEDEKTSVAPVFLVYGDNGKAKTQFVELLQLEGLSVTESTITNLQEASDKSVFDEINTLNPSHLVYFSNENDQFEGDCFTLRTNMATNLYVPWLLASVADRTARHFTHFGDVTVGEESSAQAVKGHSGKMLAYFERSLRLAPVVDKRVLELLKARKTGASSNNNV